MEVSSITNKAQFDHVKGYMLDNLSSQTLDFDSIGERFNNNDEVVKNAVEHAFRTYALENLNDRKMDDIKRILDLAIQATQRKLCAPTMPIFLINDMLSVLTIEKCSEIFCFLEDNSQIWRSELFYSSVKNYLLRMCNDLLKRLSKSQNTVFSGRIHLFLAKLFPLNEKSGLNLMSHFSDNLTRYTNTPEVFEEAINKNKSESSMEVDDADSAKLAGNQTISIDYNLYTKFWSLQEFFSKPNTCFDKAQWKVFVNNSNEVLEALKSYRLEDVKHDSSATKIDEFGDMNLYFSKYLTSEKLLDLQLNDSNFRRQILLQFLILFQYLNAEVKFKTATQVLAEDQNSWIRGAIKRVQELLIETPPSGNKFTNNIKHLLEREEIWNKWKNEGCPNFVKEKKPPAPAPAKSPLKRPKPMSSDFIIRNNKIFVTDNSEISKLCTISHDNLEACKDPNRQFLPSLKDFFEEAIEQLDPANQVEKQYQFIYQTDWSWKALRLLAKRSAYYFMQNQNVKTISEYLEAVCNKLSKEFSTDQSQLQNNSNLSSNVSALNSSSTHQHKSDNVQEVNSPITNADDSSPAPAGGKHSGIGDGLPSESVDTNFQTNDDETGQFDDEQQAAANVNADEARNDEGSSEIKSEPILSHSDQIDQAPATTVITQIKSEFPERSIKVEKEEGPTKKDLVDNELISVIVDEINDAQEWKEIAQNLNMDDDTISFIESETQDVKQQSRKILQLWKEREDKKAQPEKLLNSLNLLGKTAIADKFLAKLIETNRAPLALVQTPAVDEPIKMEQDV